MKKLLFGTTALVGACGLAGGAAAQSVSVGGALDLSISGTNDFGIEFAADDLVGGDREWTFNQDTEIVFRADGVADAADIRYGANLEVETQTGGDPEEDNGANIQFDEMWGYVQSSWGEVRFGNEDSAVDLLNINGSYVAAGTGGIDGNQRSVVDPKVTDSGESTKLIYFTPNIGGFQAGASYSIRSGDFGETFETADTSDHSDIVEVGANWIGEFSGVETGIFGGYVFSSADDDAGDDFSNFQVGATVSVYGIGIAGSYADEDGTARDSFWNLGVGGEFAGVGLSFGYQLTDLEEGDETDYFVVSGDVGLLPGVALRADVAFADFDDLDEGPDEDDFGDGINALLELRTSF